MTMQLLLRGALVTVCSRCRKRIPYHAENCTLGSARGGLEGPQPIHAVVPLNPPPTVIDAEFDDDSSKGVIYVSGSTRIGWGPLYNSPGPPIEDAATTPMFGRKHPWQWCVVHQPSRNLTPYLLYSLIEADGVVELLPEVVHKAICVNRRYRTMLDAQLWAEGFDVNPYAATRPGWRLILGTTKGKADAPRGYERVPMLALNGGGGLVYKNLFGQWASRWRNGQQFSHVTHHGHPQIAQEHIEKLRDQLTRQPKQ